MTKAARRLLAHAQLHNAIADEHKTIAKALGDLSASSTDKNLSSCCAHSALAKHHAQLALPDPATTMEKPDDTDSGKAVEWLPEAGEHFDYNQPGGSITEHTRQMLDLMGGTDMSLPSQK